MKRKVVLGVNKLCVAGKEMLLKKHKGIDGIIVVIGLCIVALLLCVVMKESLTTFVQNIVTALQTKATTILGV